MILGALLGGGYAFFLKTPVYQATAKLYIMNQDGLSIDMSALNIGKALTMDYRALSLRILKEFREYVDRSTEQALLDLMARK